jgi:RNA polymerase sigma factor (sigma-70 family)
MDRRAQFEAMYSAHGAAVRRFIYRRLPRELVDDVTGDVFVAAWRRFDERQPDELGWLLGITRGAIANRRRVESRRVALQDRLRATAVPAQDPDPGDRLLRTTQIGEAFAALRESDREVLRLVAWDGLDREEAARLLGVSPRVFSVRLHRARRRLARELARLGESLETGRGGVPNGAAARLRVQHVEPRAEPIP